jgi:Ca-activated chloride channel family protein
MLRPGLIAVVVAVLGTAPAIAGELPRQIGMYPSAGGPALAMLESRIEITMRGPIAEAVVTQRFQNRSDRATEATYVFPLPHDAAVTAMAIKNGSRTIRAAIEKRDDAQRRYEDAVRAGVDAALLDQERADVFTQTVAAIPAKGSVEITLRFDSVARFAAGKWELALPLVVAPRLVPGVATGRPTTGTGRSPDTERAPDASRVTPPGAPGAGGPTKVAIHFGDPPKSATSPTHDLKLAGAVGTFTDPKSDHDAIIRWEAKENAAGWVESASDGGYAAVMVSAPAAPAKRGPVRCTLVLDRSAVTLGDADAVARPLVRSLFAALGPTERIAVAGSDRVAWSAPADAARVIEQAWSTPAGPFDLTRVLAALRPEGSPVVLVTSGLVADDRAAVAAAQKLGVPVHVIGVGPAPGRATLTQIAGTSGGTVRFAIAGDDLASLAKATLGDLASQPPALTVTWGTLAATEVVPGTLPRLGAGQATLVLARVRRAQPANARAGGDLFAIEMLPAARAVDGATSAMGPLARRWARNRLDELVAQRATGAAIQAHALRYGLVSPHTSMVAIGTDVVVQGGAKRSVVVPVSVPAGMKWQQVKKQTKVDTSGAGADANRDLAASGKKQKQQPQPPPPDRARPEPKGQPTRKPPAKEPVTDRRPVQASPPENQRQPVAAGGATREYEADGEATLDEDDAAPLAEKSVALGRASGMDDAESIEVVSASRRYSRRRGTLLAGGGLSLSGGERDSVVGIGARLELGRTTLIGAEGNLLLVGGDVEGRVLLSIARRGIGRWFELGAGGGIHLGTGVGPAATIGLRVYVPPFPRVAPYLRYDGALLFDDGTRRGQHAITLGIELGF